MRARWTLVRARPALVRVRYLESSAQKRARSSDVVHSFMQLAMMKFHFVISDDDCTYFTIMK